MVERTIRCATMQADHCLIFHWPDSIFSLCQTSSFYIGNFKFHHKKQRLKSTLILCWWAFSSQVISWIDFRALIKIGLSADIDRQYILKI